MKYVVFEIDGLQQPILFPEFIEHQTMALKFAGKKVISAGMVFFRDGIVCTGDSFSLNVKSRGELDSDLIFRHLGGIR